MSRLQTFPGDIDLAGDYADAQRQLGNAVPSLLAEVLAREIRRQLLGRPPTRKLPRLALAAARGPAPRPELVKPVTAHFLRLRGEHEAHPGTGQGYGAAARWGLAS
jgi:DNA (cytosine-5)-methyltransferase 1